MRQQFYPVCTQTFVGASFEPKKATFINIESGKHVEFGGGVIVTHFKVYKGRYSRPVRIHMNKADAEALGRALLRAADDQEEGIEA